MYQANQLPVPTYVSGGMGSIDLSTMSWEDYLIIGGVGAFLLSTMWGSRPKRRKRAKKTASGGGLGLGMPVALIALPLLAVVGYMYFSSSTSAQDIP